MFLVIDTSTAATVVAFCDASGACLWQAPREDGMRHGDALLPHIERGLEAVSKAPADVDALVVGVGPGSFTGLRIGLATAQGWSLAMGTPAFGVLSPLAVAAPLLREAPVVAVIGDAFKGEVALSVFERGPDAAPTIKLPPRAMLPEEVASALFDLHLSELPIAAGDGLRRFLESTPSLTACSRIADVSADVPDAAALVAAALRARAAGDDGRADLLAPHYVRDADAKLPATPLKL